MSAVRVRRAEARDAASHLALDRALVDAGVGQVRLPDDLPDEATMARRLAQEPLHWVAVEGDRVLGGVSVRRMGPGLLRHVGMLGIGVHPDAQGRGLGTRLMHAAIDGAFAAGIERLELGVRADNPRAIALYERLGFHHEARRVRFVRRPDGTYVDDLSMVRFAPGHGPDDTMAP